MTLPAPSLLLPMLRPMLRRSTGRVLRPAAGSADSTARLVSPGSLGPGMTFQRASTGQASNSTDTGLDSYAIDMPRFSGPSRRLAVEGARTNLALYSATFTNANWLKNGLTTTADVIPAPMVGQFADMLTVPAGAAIQQIYQNRPVTGGTVVTCSIYVRLGTMPQSDFLSAFYDVTNSAFIMVDVPPPKALTTGAFTRLEYQVAIPATCTSLRFSPYRNANPATGGTVYIWGAQIEAAPFASSYIPTTVTTATRAVDIAFSALSTVLPGWALVGTFMIPAAGAGLGEGGLFVVDDGTVSNRVTFRRVSGTASLEPRKQIGGTTTGGASAGTIVAGVPFKAGLAGDGTSISAVLNGAAPATIAGPLPPGLNRILLGRSLSGSDPQIIEIGPLDLYPTRLSDAQLQALTA